MKKVLSLITILFLVFLITGCGNNNEANNQNGSTSKYAYMDGLYIQQPGEDFPASFSYLIKDGRIYSYYADSSESTILIRNFYGEGVTGGIKFKVVNNVILSDEERDMSTTNGGIAIKYINGKIIIGDGVIKWQCNKYNSTLCAASQDGTYIKK